MKALAVIFSSALLCGVNSSPGLFPPPLSGPLPYPRLDDEDPWVLFTRTPDSTHRLEGTSLTYKLFNGHLDNVRAKEREKEKSAEATAKTQAQSHVQNQSADVKSEQQPQSGSDGHVILPTNQTNSTPYNNTENMNNVDQQPKSEKLVILPKNQTSSIPFNRTQHIKEVNEIAKVVKEKAFPFGLPLWANRMIYYQKNLDRLANSGDNLEALEDPGNCLFHNDCKHNHPEGKNPPARHDHESRATPKIYPRSVPKALLGNEIKYLRKKTGADESDTIRYPPMDGMDGGLVKTRNPHRNDKITGSMLSLKKMFGTIPKVGPEACDKTLNGRDLENLASEAYSMVDACYHTEKPNEKKRLFSTNLRRKPHNEKKRIHPRDLQQRAAETELHKRDFPRTASELEGMIDEVNRRPKDGITRLLWEERYRGYGKSLYKQGQFSGWRDIEEHPQGRILEGYHHRVVPASVEEQWVTRPKNHSKSIQGRFKKLLHSSSRGPKRAYAIYDKGEIIKRDVAHEMPPNWRAFRKGDVRRTPGWEGRHDIPQRDPPVGIIHRDLADTSRRISVPHHLEQENPPISSESLAGREMPPNWETPFRAGVRKPPGWELWHGRARKDPPVGIIHRDLANSSRRIGTPGHLMQYNLAFPPAFVGGGSTAEEPIDISGIIVVAFVGVSIVIIIIGACIGSSILFWPLMIVCMIVTILIWPFMIVGRFITRSVSKIDFGKIKAWFAHFNLWAHVRACVRARRERKQQQKAAQDIEMQAPSETQPPAYTETAFTIWGDNPVGRDEAFERAYFGVA